MEKDIAKKTENACPVDYAIRVSGVSKTFRIPHEKITSLRGAFVNAFSKNKGYEEFQALDDVSFEVKKGEFFGIIGRNGSGKSTLLKILAGIYQPDRGKVKVNGLISPFLELGIGFNPELSGRDNVFLNASVLGLTHKQIEEKFDDIVNFSELQRFIDQKVKNYSSGMLVRLMFSTAIHANREILLMDEVLAVGDTNFQSKCLEKFNEYRDQGKTVVLVTHDVMTIQRYCDRAMLMRDGKIVKIGKAKDIVDTYTYQNMSDEEKRILEEEKQKSIKEEKKLEKKKEREREEEKKRIVGDEKKQNKVAEIKRVEFLDAEGKIKNSFYSGEDILIRVYFKINKKNNIINFGFGLYNSYDNYIFGISSISDKIDVANYLEKGYFQLLFTKNTLMPNSYYIKASLVRNNFLEANVYDFIAKSSSFRIFSNENKNEGIYDMDYNWY